MMEFNFYESINCHRSHIFDRYRYVVDIFSHRFRLRKGRYRSPEIFGLKKCLHKITDSFEIPYVEDHRYFLEFQIVDINLVTSLLNIGNKEFLVNRYVVDWTSGNYFLYKLLCSVFYVNDNIFVIRCKMISRIDKEDLNINPLSIIRDTQLQKLLK